MNEKSDESAKQQPADTGQPEAQERPEYRDVSPDELKQILEAHQKWVESGGKEGKRADLSGANLKRANLRKANLQRANLTLANLQGADFRLAKGATASQIKRANNWRLAFYRDDFFAELCLPADHNDTVKKKLAKIEKEKENTVTKP